VIATADHVAAMRRSEKKITISFDEWNVWFAERNADREPGSDAEDVYDVSEAVVVGSLLIELIRHSDRVAIACQAQLVNLLAPILTRPGGPAWRQTIFHPFALTSRHAGPVVLAGAGAGPMINTERYGAVGQLHTVSTHDPDSGEVVIFAVNRGAETALDFCAELDGFGRPGWSLLEHLMITDADPHAKNTEDNPDRVVPRRGGARVADGVVLAELPPISWHCIRLTPTDTPS
jgi:alpha-N-arabinofuranosidase